MAKLKKWWEVYPIGTVAGNEEARFFKVLAQNPKFKYRSTDVLASEAKLPAKRVEEIILKYHKQGIVVQSASNPKLWAYWENVDEKEKDTSDVIKKDKSDRINKKK